MSRHIGTSRTPEDSTSGTRHRPLQGLPSSTFVSPNPGPCLRGLLCSGCRARKEVTRVALTEAKGGVDELLRLADALNTELESQNGRAERSGRGQFATPSQAARVMASLVEPTGGDCCQRRICGRLEPLRHAVRGDSSNNPIIDPVSRHDAMKRRGHRRGATIRWQGLNQALDGFTIVRTGHLHRRRPRRILRNRASSPPSGSRLIRQLTAPNDDRSGSGSAAQPERQPRLRVQDYHYSLTLEIKLQSNRVIPCLEPRSGRLLTQRCGKGV